MSMYNNLASKVGKAVSIKMSGGTEVVGYLESLDQDGNTITMKHPHTVFVSDGELMIMKYMMTSDSEHFRLNYALIESVASANEEIQDSLKTVINQDK